MNGKFLLLYRKKAIREIGGEKGKKMKSNRKKNAIVISGIAVLVVIAMAIAVSANLSWEGLDIAFVELHNNGPGGYVVPNQTYCSHIINVTDNSSLVNVSATWYTNVTNFTVYIDNGTVANDDITNISIFNISGGTRDLYGYNNTPAGSEWLITGMSTDYSWVNDTTTLFSVNLTVNTTGLVDGAWLTPNVTVGAELFNDTWAAIEPTAAVNGTNITWVNDTAAETIEVLNATAGPSAGSASEGSTNVLCANVTIFPGNTSVDNYLKKITFNTTAATTINPTLHIASFGLWNDTDASKTFSSTTDTSITSSSPTDGSNVTFDLTDLPVTNRIILPAGGTFFLTMDIKTPAPKPLYTVIYQAQISNQSITINMSGSNAGNTGNNSVTEDFTPLTVNLIARVPEFNTVGLIAFIGIVSVVLAVVTLRRKR